MRGFPWDSVNHSCAYDSLLTILLSVYCDNYNMWKAEMSQQSNILSQLGRLFEAATKPRPSMTLIEVRDFIRNMLGSRDSSIGIKGSTPTDICTVVRAMLATEQLLTSHYNKCRACDYNTHAVEQCRVTWICDQSFWKNHPAKLGIYKGKSISKWMQALMLQNTEEQCPTCHRHMVKVENYINAPNIFALIMTTTAVIETSIILPGTDQMYRLAGIIYYHDCHFVCRVIDKSGQVWFHDGVENGDTALYEDNIVNIPMKKLQCKGNYVMSMLLYTKM